MFDLLVFVFHILFFCTCKEELFFLKLNLGWSCQKPSNLLRKIKAVLLWKLLLSIPLYWWSSNSLLKLQRMFLSLIKPRNLWRLVLHSLHRNYLLLQPIAFIDTANTLFRLSKVNFEDSAMYKNGTDVNPGTELKLELVELKKSRKISVSQTFKVLIRCCIIFVIPLCSSGREVSN